MNKLRQHHRLDMLADQALNHGDADAFKRLVEEVRPILVNACRTLGGAVVDAEDHAQEALIRAAQWNPGTFMLPATPGSRPAIQVLLSTTARNIAKSSLAKAARQERLFFGPFAGEDDTTRSAHARARATWLCPHTEPDVNTSMDDRLERVLRELSDRDVVDLQDWAAGRKPRNRMVPARAKAKARHVAGRLGLAA